MRRAACRTSSTEGEFDRIVDPAKMVHPYVADAG
jgi:hypothetical protein